MNVIDKNYHRKMNLLDKYKVCVCVCVCVWFIFYEFQHFGQELQNSNFSNGKHFFLFIDKFLKFNKIEYLIYCTKFEMWPVLFYVNSTCYFQNWNINYVVTFLNSSKNSKLKFFNVGLKLYLNLLKLIFSKFTMRWHFWMLL